MKSLHKITGKKSGVVIYPDFQLVCNWQSIDGLPRIFAGSLFGMGEELELVNRDYVSKEQIKQILPDMKSSDISSGGYLYKVKSNNEIFEVVTIDDWY